MEVACVAALIQLVLSAFMVIIDKTHDVPQMMGWRRLIWLMGYAQEAFIISAVNCTQLLLMESLTMSITYSSLTFAVVLQLKPFLMMFWSSCFLPARIRLNRAQYLAMLEIVSGCMLVAVSVNLSHWSENEMSLFSPLAGVTAALLTISLGCYSTVNCEELVKCEEFGLWDCLFQLSFYTTCMAWIIILIGTDLQTPLFDSFGWKSWLLSFIQAGIGGLTVLVLKHNNSIEQTVTTTLASIHVDGLKSILMSKELDSFSLVGSIISILGAISLLWEEEEANDHYYGCVHADEEDDGDDNCWCFVV
eukprot:gene11210-12501_t